MASLKEQKEAFVTGLDGTTPQELLLICSSVPIGLWLFQFLPADTYTTRWKAVLAEALVFWIPMILCQTNYLYPWGVGYLGMQVLAAAACEIRRATSTTASVPLVAPTRDDNRHDGKLGYLTVYRAALMYMTFVAILAVDFHVFPRRFVKTEETGYSLMDLGAASFVVAAGLVSLRARSASSKKKKQHHQQSTWRRYATRILPLVFMGSLRLVTHKELEYQEHVSEYGVHWNFFYTLAMLVPVAAVLPGPGWILPTILATCYQYVLSEQGLQEWVLEAPRSCQTDYSGRLLGLCNLFVANREGVLGCIGYGALYLMSEWIGFRFVWNDASSRQYGLLACAGGLVVLWQLLIMMTGIPVSRRTTNTIFIVWALVVNILQLVGIRYAWMRGGKVPSVLMAVNRHGLLTFVLANLLTGAVNLLINTLEVSDPMALAILFGYVSVVGALAVLTDVAANSLQSMRRNGQKQD